MQINAVASAWRMIDVKPTVQGFGSTTALNQLRKRRFVGAWKVGFAGKRRPASSGRGIKAMVSTHGNQAKRHSDFSRPSDARRQMSPAIAEALVSNRGDFFGYLVRRLRDKDAAEDVFQDFHLRVLKSGAELKNSDSALAWLYRVLRSTLVDHYRSVDVRRRGEAGYADFTRVCDHGAEDVSLDDGACSCVEAALPLLRSEHVEVLRKIYFDGASHEMAAADLDVTQGNLRVRLCRARRALGQTLGSCCGRGFHECECGSGHKRFDLIADNPGEKHRSKGSRH